MKEYKINEELKQSLTNIIAKAIHPDLRHDIVNAFLSQLVNLKEIKENPPEETPFALAFF